MNRGNRTLELYNLADDPSERRDVAGQHPEIVEKLESLMRREHVRSELFPLVPFDGD